MEEVETVVVGAGVVGLAIARELALSGQEVLVLERAALIGSETSSRNSEVIHAGIYYPPGSLKARLCVAGKQALYDHCASHGVGYKRCGKLVVASEEPQLSGLKALAERAQANGVEVSLIPAAQAQEMEPALRCVGALWSPSTGIIDSHGYMLSLQGELEAAGGFIAFQAPVEAAAAENGGFRLSVGGPHPMEIRTGKLVNAAGLYAVSLAQRLEGLGAEHIPQAHFAKGNYFTLQGAAPFSRLIYPMPVPGGLGIHVTLDLAGQALAALGVREALVGLVQRQAPELSVQRHPRDLAGQARFGPDIQWVERPDDYDLDPSRADSFYESIRRYWPDLPDGALAPAYCGMRPKIHGPDEPAPDFRIDGPERHGLPGLVNLFGIESPGLTSSLAIAKQVEALLRG